MRGAIDFVTIVKMGVTTPDGEGRFGAAVESTSQVWGRVLLNTDKEAEEGRYAEDINITVVLPVGTPISPKDRIIVPLNFRGSNAPFVGTYEVMTVNFMQGDLECEARQRDIT